MMNVHVRASAPLLVLLVSGLAACDAPPPQNPPSLWLGFNNDESSLVLVTEGLKRTF